MKHLRGRKDLAYLLGSGVLGVLLWGTYISMKMQPVGFGNRPTRAMSNVKQLALALLNYAEDHDGVLPYVSDTLAAKNALSKYVKSADLWTTSNPQGKDILFNPALGGTRAKEIPNPAEVAMVYEAAPWPTGRRAVGFADSHVKAFNDGGNRVLAKSLSLNLKKYGQPIQ